MACCFREEVRINIFTLIAGRTLVNDVDYSTICTHVLTQKNGCCIFVTK